jgi:hypothetical protein
MAAVAADPNKFEIIALQFQPKKINNSGVEVDNGLYNSMLDYKELIKENTDGILFIYQSSIESFLNGIRKAEGGTAVVQPGRIESTVVEIQNVKYKSAGILTGTNNNPSQYLNLDDQLLQSINYDTLNNTIELTKTPYKNPEITPTNALSDGLKNIYIYAINPANNIRKIYYSADLNNPRYLGLGIFSDPIKHSWTANNINIIQIEFQNF